MIKYHFAYKRTCRKCVDDLEQLKKEMWVIVMNPNAEIYSRFKSTIELQSLFKMSVFTLRYLLFVANLSKFNDLSNLDKP